MNRILYISLFVLLVSACKKDVEVISRVDPKYDLNIPNGFPDLDIPEDNQLSISRVEFFSTPGSLEMKVYRVLLVIIPTKHLPMVKYYQSVSIIKLELEMPLL